MVMEVRVALLNVVSCSTSDNAVAKGPSTIGINSRVCGSRGLIRMVAFSVSA
jgi:hypothetical protein